MNMSKVSKISIVNWVLYATIVLLIGGIGYGVYMTHQRLTSYVTEVDHLKIDSELNQQSIENAKKLRSVLDENKDSVARAASIVADSKSYQYQDQIVQDIGSYANTAGLTVLGYDFISPSAAQATGKTAAPTTASGVKTVVATVSLKSPVPYDRYLKFLRLIERNLTKMQVTQLDISNDLKTPGSISSPIVTVEVFVR